MSAVPRSLAQYPLRLHRMLPPSPMKDRLRAVLFRGFGAPRWHPRLQLPRKDLLIDPGDIAVMIGTPNTHRVAQLADLVGATGSVLIVEPVPENYDRLSEAATDYDNVTIDNHGAWHTETTRTISIIPDNKGRSQATIAPRDQDARKTIGEIKVNLAPLDNILSTYNLAPDYVEVMVNGAEFEVLRGATTTMQHFRPRLLIKSYGTGTNEQRDTEFNIRSLLAAYGYTVSAAPTRTAIPGDGAPDGDFLAWK